MPNRKNKKHPAPCTTAAPDTLNIDLSASATAARETLRVSSRTMLVLFIFALLISGLFFAYKLMQPFLNPVVVAVVFAALFYPVYKRVLVLFGNRPSLASGVVTLFVILLVVVPFIFFIAGLIPQMRQSITALTQWVGSAQLDTIFNEHLSIFFEWIHDHAPFLGITAESVKTDLVNLSRQAGQMAIGFSTNVVGQTVSFGINFLLFSLALFFFLKDGAALIARIKFLSPLREEQEDRIIYNLQRISRAVLLGGFAVAALQGFVGGIGLALVGIPGLFWGTVMSVVSLIPLLGTALVWVPASIYLFLIGSWKSALFLTLWCGLLVSSLDTFLRPLLMRDASGIPVLFLFLSILGGLHAFGALGILYGPLILTFAVVMLAIYGEEYQEQLEGKGGC